MLGPVRKDQDEMAFISWFYQQAVWAPPPHQEPCSLWHSITCTVSIYSRGLESHEGIHPICLDHHCTLASVQCLAHNSYPINICGRTEWGVHLSHPPEKESSSRGGSPQCLHKTWLRQDAQEVFTELKGPSSVEVQWTTSDQGMGWGINSGLFMGSHLPLLWERWLLYSYMTSFPYLWLWGLNY